MAPGLGVKPPVSRTRTGCLTCRKGKVKCDEEKPDCRRCRRLQFKCTWTEQHLQAIAHRRRPQDRAGELALIKPSSQTFVVEFPNADRSTIPYIKHFITFCSRFLAYSNDAEGNPFQEELVPLASSSPALLHSMVALAAGHMARGHPHHTLAAVKHYSIALRELNSALSNPSQVRLNSTLGACLMLCVYEISHSDRSLWLEHLMGARDLIMYRGGPKTSDFLSRFFSLLDISGSLSSGQGPLIPGNYWLDDASEKSGDSSSAIESKPKWPYYDDGVMVESFHALMVYMAKLSRLSVKSMTEFGKKNPELIKQKATRIRRELNDWWATCPPALRDQSNDWRRIPRSRKLTVPEILEEESFSSTRSCVYACTIYLQHIIDPTGREPQKPEVSAAIKAILDIAKETPEGYGLEMGLLWGLFMAGVAIFNDIEAEALIRKKLRSDASAGIYHADGGLELLEVLWEKQHRNNIRYDWREVQSQMGVKVFILA